MDFDSARLRFSPVQAEESPESGDLSSKDLEGAPRGRGGVPLGAKANGLGLNRQIRSGDRIAYKEPRMEMSILPRSMARTER